MNTKSIALICLSAIEIGGIVFCCTYQAPQVSSQQISTVTEQTVPPVSYEKDMASSEANNIKLELLSAIERQTLNGTADYSVYVHYVNQADGEYLYHNKIVRSASMIKVFILAALMEAEKKGEIAPDQTFIVTDEVKVGGAGSLSGYPDGSVLSLHELEKLMIAQSDNTATNMLIDYLGMETINQYIQENGYTETSLQRKMMDFDPADPIDKNQTSAGDLGKIFTRIYRHQCVDPEYDERMIQLLLQQTDDTCFPAALPDYRIAHKTGELEHLYHDGGIVYSPFGDYVLCVLAEDIADYDEALQTMRNIAELADMYNRNSVIS